MFRRLTRGREHLHAALDMKMFEQACTPYFEIVRSLALPGTQRRMYCLKRKAVAIERARATRAADGAPEGAVRCHSL